MIKKRLETNKKLAHILILHRCVTLRDSECRCFVVYDAIANNSKTGRSQEKKNRNGNQLFYFLFISEENDV